MSTFNCPVVKPRLTSPFGWRDIGRGKEWHQGVDLASPIAGTKVPVYASADGVVKRAGVLSTYGNRVLLNHNIGGKTYETNYAHLDKIIVKEGQRVKQGEQIGIMGNTGGSFGVHLHFEIHNGLYAAGQPNAVDPMKWVTLYSCVPLGSAEEGELTMSQYKELMTMINELKKENAELKQALNNKLDKEAPRKVSATHAKNWDWMKANGISDGSNPQSFATREQVGTMIERYHEKFK